MKNRFTDRYVQAPPSSLFSLLMSRSSSLRQTLQLPADHSLEVLSIEPSGDCFYDCMHALLSKTPNIKHFSKSSLFLRGDYGDESTTIPSSQLMREYVADQLTLEQFDLYQMFAAAGVEEYSFMSLKDAPQNLTELKDFARRSGRQYGPGKCLWADEFALRTISDGLDLTVLIVDDQAQRESGSTKRKRGGGAKSNQADGRFVSIGNYGYGVILHRSRREHFNAVLIDGYGAFDLGQSPVSSLWPTIDVHSKNFSCNEDEIKQAAGDTTIVRKSILGASVNGSSEEKQDSMRRSIGKFYVGCAGFSNSTWVGSFYPKAIVGNNSDRQLNHYQEHFSTVELNSTFYGLPSESTVLKWKSLCAASFRLVAKAPKGVTHENDKLSSSTLVFFLNRMEPLKGVLVCVLIQCPRTLVVDVSQLEQVKTDLQKQASWYSGYLAFEFRNHKTFHDTNVRAFLAANKWPFVVHPDSLERSTIGSSVSGRGTSDLVEYEPQKLSRFAPTCSLPSDLDMIYIRLHGSNDEHRSIYTVMQLREMSEQIHIWRTHGKDVFCYFLNDLEHSLLVSPPKDDIEHYSKWPAMPKNAKQLEQLVFQLADELVPDAPRKPKATLLNFFARK